MFYAGIGSRTTPNDVLEDMETIGAMLASKGYILRSGGAGGADEAFESGCNSVDPKLKEIWIPWRSYSKDEDRSRIFYKTDWRDFHEIVSNYHPNWNACNDAVKSLHCRNLMIITGDFELSSEVIDTKCGFVVCYTPKGSLVGGTAVGIRIAEDLGIPVYNLGTEGMLEKLLQFIEELPDVN